MNTAVETVEPKNAPAILPPRLPYHPAIEERFGVGLTEWRALVDAVFPLAKEPSSVILALSYCKARNLDPFKRPVHIVPMWNSAAKRMCETVWPGIGELRTTAFRTGQYAGRDEAKYGETKNECIGSVAVQYPEWCQVTVYRLLGGQRLPFPGPRVYWRESYATAGRDDPSPNAMWRRRPFGQIDKCFDAETEVLTDHGFQRFAEVSGRILQVTPAGLDPTESKPFQQYWEGPMIAADGEALNFCVTPNHDMIVDGGVKIEAASLYAQATAIPKLRIPHVVLGDRPDNGFSEESIRLAAAFVADGWVKTDGCTFTISVSRPAKVDALNAWSLHHSSHELQTAGDVAIASNGRRIVTQANKTAFVYDLGQINGIADAGKAVNADSILSMSRRQAKLFVDTWLAFDGADNGRGTRRIYTSRQDHAASFELAAICAGYAVSPRRERQSDIGGPNYTITITERASAPVLRYASSQKRRAATRVKQVHAGLTMKTNESGEVWCVTVPSGAIVVRRAGFSMVCGNCAEAAALRAAFPEEVGNEYAAEEMEGKVLGDTIDNATGEIRPAPRSLSERMDMLAAGPADDAVTEQSEQPEPESEVMPSEPVPAPAGEDVEPPRSPEDQSAAGGAECPAAEQGPDESPPVAGETAAKTLADYDTELTEAAKRGTAALQEAWGSVPAGMKHLLKAALDRRHKPSAVAADAALSGSEASQAAPATGAEPTTEAEYVEHATSWIKAATSRDSALSHWTREKKLRNTCNVSPEVRDQIKEKIDAIFA